jgi:hypothetical protein
LYEENFGQMPKNMWVFKSMFDSLNLEKAKLKIRTFIIIGIFGFIGLSYPFYLIIQPVYLKIDNPYFIIGLIILSIFVFLVLEGYNRTALRKLLLLSDNTSFIFNLEASELVYSNTQKLSDVINGFVNELIENGTIEVNHDKTVQLSEDIKPISVEHLQIVSALRELGKTYYPNLLIKLISKPIFSNTNGGIDAFRKYFNKSQKFGILFYSNFAVIALLIMFSFIRIVAGIYREKPVVQIVLVTLILTVIGVIFLNRLTKQITSQIVPDFYKKEILPKLENNSSFQWRYFLFGTSILNGLFIPIVNIVDRDNSPGSFGGSCGSSCGSSCSSCGGCGGGD